MAVSSLALLSSGSCWLAVRPCTRTPLAATLRRPVMRAADASGDGAPDATYGAPDATLLTALLDADASSPLPTTATAVAAWFANGHARGELKLGLLPFLLEHAMLPGERRCVYLFDDSLQECVAAASASHSCVGGLLFNPDGNHYNLALLLRIEEIKQGHRARTRTRTRNPDPDADPNPDPDSNPDPDLNPNPNQALSAPGCSWPR